MTLKMVLTIFEKLLKQRVKLWVDVVPSEMEWLRAATLETHMGINIAFSIMSKHMCVQACISDGPMTLKRIWHLVVMKVRAHGNALHSYLGEIGARVFCT